MMFLHVCVCVTFIIVFISLSPFFSFLFLFYFLIVYKFSPPLPRFFIFSISSSRFTNDFVFISICAPIGGSIIDFCLSLLHQKKPNSLSLSFQQTAATAFATLKKGARGEQNEDTERKTARFVCFMRVWSRIISKIVMRLLSKQSLYLKNQRQSNVTNGWCVRARDAQF